LEKELADLNFSERPPFGHIGDDDPNEDDEDEEFNRECRT
jgi:hypothetical protein